MKIDPSTLFLLFALLPGFVGVSLYCSLRRIKITTSILIVFALFLNVCSNFIITIFTNLSINLNENNINYLFSYDALKYITISTFVSSILSLLLSWVVGRDVLAKILYKMKFQGHFSDDLVWDRVFRENNRRWVTIEYHDGSKLIGYAKWYSQRGKKYSVCLGDAEFRKKMTIGKVERNIKISYGGDLLLTSFEGVRFISFKEPNND